MLRGWAAGLLPIDCTALQPNCVYSMAIGKGQPYRRVAPGPLQVRYKACSRAAAGSLQGHSRSQRGFFYGCPGGSAPGNLFLLLPTFELARLEHNKMITVEPVLFLYLELINFFRTGII